MGVSEYKPYVIDTGYLFPPSLADFLGSEDEVHVFGEVTEQVFGQIKDGLGFRGTTVRGTDQARAQWLSACAVHNTLKAVRYISRGRKGACQPGDLALASD